MVKKLTVDHALTCTFTSSATGRTRTEGTTMAGTTRSTKSATNAAQSESATDAIGQALAALPADQLAALLAKAGLGQPAPAAPAPRQAATSKPRDPSVAAVAAAVAAEVGCIKPRGANGIGEAYSTGSRGYRGNCKITVDGVPMSVTLQVVIDKSKPQS